MTSPHARTEGNRRLGRGDGATAIAANMQITAGWGWTRMWNGATTAGDAQRAGALEGLLRMLGDGQTVVSFPFTEAGTATGFPLTEAIATDGGWVLNGRKMFATLSPAAQLFFVLVRVADAAGSYHTGIAAVPRGTAGLEVLDNWDALGMRASGSHDILLTDCVVSAEAVQVLSPWGVLNEVWLPSLIVNNISLVAVSLGIAETARDLIVEQVKTRRKAPSNRRLAERYPMQYGVAELEIALAACRAMLDRTFLAVDAYFATHPAAGVPLAGPCSDRPKQDQLGPIACSSLGYPITVSPKRSDLTQRD